MSNDDLRVELEAAGIDLSTPDARRSFRDDIVFAHSMRKRCEKITGYIILAIIGGVLTTLGVWLSTGAKEWLSK